MAAGDDYPVAAGQDGIKLKTEKMVADQLYHCVYDSKVFLFYKDENDLLHCYEVENPDAVREIAANPSEIESILKKYASQVDQKELE
jgi:hypothetical protein